MVVLIEVENQKARPSRNLQGRQVVWHDVVVHFLGEQLEVNDLPHWKKVHDQIHCHAFAKDGLVARSLLQNLDCAAFRLHRFDVEVNEGSPRNL